MTYPEWSNKFGMAIIIPCILFGTLYAPLKDAFIKTPYEKDYIDLRGQYEALKNDYNKLINFFDTGVVRLPDGSKARVKGK